MKCTKCGYISSAYPGSPLTKCSACGAPFSKPTVHTATTIESTVDQNKQKISIVIALTVGLIVGYFAGREHVKYEMRSAISAATEEFKKNIGSIFSDANPKTDDEKKTLKQNKQPQPTKTFHILAALIKKDWVEGEYGQSAITFTIRLANTFKKDVRAFDGVLVFTDLLNNDILRANLAINDPLGSGQVINWNGQIDYNQFIASHKELRYADIQNIKVQFILKKALFIDGEVKEF